MSDCSEVLADVWLFLDHDCDRRPLLVQHLEECGCLREYGFDEKRLLTAGLNSDRGLKDRLRQQIRVAVLEQAEVTVEASPDATTTTVEVRGRRTGQQGQTAARGPMKGDRVDPAPAAMRMLSQASQVLPGHARARYHEEFSSELIELAAVGASRRQQLIHCLRVWVRAWSLRRALCAVTPAEGPVL